MTTLEEIQRIFDHDNAALLVVGEAGKGKIMPAVTARELLSRIVKIGGEDTSLTSPSYRIPFSAVKAAGCNLEIWDKAAAKGVMEKMQTYYLMPEQQVPPEELGVSGFIKNKFMETLLVIANTRQDSLDAHAERFGKRRTDSATGRQH